MGQIRFKCFSPQGFLPWSSFGSGMSRGSSLHPYMDTQCSVVCGVFCMLKITCKSCCSVVLMQDFSLLSLSWHHSSPKTTRWVLWTSSLVKLNCRVSCLKSHINTFIHSVQRGKQTQNKWKNTSKEFCFISKCYLLSKQPAELLDVCFSLVICLFQQKASKCTWESFSI